MKIKKILCGILIVASVFSVTAFSKNSAVNVEASIESELAEKKNELKKLENALSEAKGKKEKILAAIKEKEGKLNALLYEKNQLEASILYSENEIVIIESLISGYEEHLAELEVSLSESEKLRKEKIEQLCLVLKYIYENGDVSSLELFFSSDSFSEYISKKEYAKTVLSYQQTIISEIESVAAETEKAKSDYEKSKASLEGYRQVLEDRKLTVADEYAILDSLLASVKGEIELSESEYNAIDEIEKQYAEEIGRVKLDIEDLTDYLSSRYIWPFATNQSYYISSHFGYRYGPFSGYEHHNGVDIVVPHGTPILASSGGVVTRSEYAPVFGNVVVVTHSNGVQTLYCHCSKRLVSVGDRVKQGEKIALVGSTGNSTGAHLHFAFILNGKYVNPNKYVAKEYFR